MQLRHYTWVIWRSLRLILLVTCLISGATYGISKLIPPVYQASTLLQVNMTGDGSTVYTNQIQALTDSLLVTNTDVLQATAQQLPGVTVSDLQKEVSAAPLDSTSVIQILVQAHNPQQAADIANGVAQNFINIQVTEVNNALLSNLQQLNQMLVTAKDNLVSDQQQLDALQKSQASNATIARQVGIVNDAQAKYDTLVLQYQQTQEQQLQIAHSLIQTQKALPPTTALSPRVSLNTLIAAALSLLLVLVFVLIRDWLDTSIRTPEDVAQRTALEPLGSVPFNKGAQMSVAALEADKERNGAVEQTFTILSRRFSLEHKRRCAVLVTAVRSGAGTTTVAAHFALSLVQTGKRVLLIDANLRRPALHTFFQRSNSHGLADGLVDIHRLHEKEALAWVDQWSTHIPNFWLLPAGPLGTEPQTVLQSPDLELLTHWLLGQTQDFRSSASGSGVVDYIVIDAPSLQDGADAVALTSLADYTLLVAEAGKEQSKTLNDAGAVFQKLDAPVLGVIINRQAAQHRPYFYVDNPPPSFGVAEGLPEGISKSLVSKESVSALKVAEDENGVVQLPFPSSSLFVPHTDVPASPLPGQSLARDFRGSN